MGIVRQGPPEAFVLALARRFDLPTFVETGTFKGGTSLWASRHFRQVLTIEASPEIHAAARETLAGQANITCLLGDSGVLIRSLVASATPGVFWLDAHFSFGNTAGEAAECPLLAEIDAIAPTLDRNVVLIDDARMFLAPPPKPHKPSHWPSIAEVVEALRSRHKCYVCVFDDIIVAAPAEMQAFITELLVNRGR